MKKAILVTGTSSGFGRLIVETLAQDGHQIFATMREISGKNAIAAAHLKEQARLNNWDIHISEMDVSNDSSVTSAIQRIHTHTQALDVVVNNAGFAYAGLTEAFSTSDVADTFNGNVLGPMRVNNAVLPLMRRKQHGLLIHITSAAAHNHLPFMSVYSGAKAAMDLIAEGYALELKQLGIDTCIIEPGAFPTEGMGKVKTPQNAGITPEYGVVAEVMQQYFAGLEERISQYQEQSPQTIADTVKQIINSPQGERPLRHVVGDVMTAQAQEINRFSEPLQTSFFQQWGVGQLLD